MRSGLLWGVVLVAAGLVSGCSAEGKLASKSALSGGLWTVKVQSPAFEHQGEIPEKYTQEGMNVSPPLKWSAGPAGVKEWVVIVEDADSKVTQGPEKGRPALHWMVYGIPGNVHELPEGAASQGTYLQGKNYSGETGYAGPMPPAGKKHRYYFQVFALDSEQSFTSGMTRTQLAEKLKGHVLSKGQLIGTYTLPSD